MAQPVQIFDGTPEGSYSVIDNGPAGNGGVPGGIGYDTTTGAIAQGSNTFTNGTIPDAANNPKFTVTAQVGVNNSTVKWKNPA